MENECLLRSLLLLLFKSYIKGFVNKKCSNLKIMSPRKEVFNFYLVT